MPAGIYCIWYIFMKPVLAQSFRLEEELINELDLVKRDFPGSVISLLMEAK